MAKNLTANISAYAQVLLLWIVAAALALALLAGLPLAIITIHGAWITHAAANGRTGEPGVVIRILDERDAQWAHTCKGEFRLANGQTVLANFESAECTASTRGRLIHDTPWTTTVVKDGSTEWRNWAFMSLLPVLWTLALTTLLIRRLRKTRHNP